ncbi:uncharacterized protein C8Q71DRAFT_908602 [Rhodofomes roseus]|uniref:Uncharacterized protein n=1 Tax=Rhodofomes roseus TaxID=34475 RepID=A0ABQ8KAZ6_9APHY|nr:uncharacterized protein C8Q71DRAFT_908602 [Rhodofomes roseus]KAH9834726.1 hypothetical protein C8Q71DRAFT_908602 [Rhodofomes roseus]
MGLKSFLRSLFAHCSLPFMATPTEELPMQLSQLLQPNVSQPLDPTQKRLFDMTSLENCYLNGNPKLYDCVITNVWLYKATSLSNHEFIVLNVTYHGRDIGFLRAERTVDRPESNGSSWTPNASSWSISTVSSVSSTSSGTAPASPSLGVPAHDIVTLCATENRQLLTKDGEQIAHSALDPPPSFAAIVAACLVVSRRKPFYELLSGQCYWFAGVVIRLICDDGARLERILDTKHKEGEWQNFLRVMSGARMNAGAEKLRSKYTATLLQLRNQANTRVQEAGRQVELREEAERQAAEERRRREVVERKAAEERRRREEAERKAEDLQRMLNELRASQGLTAADTAPEATPTDGHGQSSSMYA